MNVISAETSLFIWFVWLVHSNLSFDQIIYFYLSFKFKNFQVWRKYVIVVINIYVILFVFSKQGFEIYECKKWLLYINLNWIKKKEF